MARKRELLPIMLGMNPPNKQGIGIKSRTFERGYDLYIMQDDMSGCYAWIHFLQYGSD